MLPFAREASNLLANRLNADFYRKLDNDYHFRDRIKMLKGTQKGKRCFIVGNGPSLTMDQLEAIKDEDCFGANRVYKLFDKTTWRPKYYVLQDKYDLTKGVYEKLNVEYFFVSDAYWREHGMDNQKAICYHGIRAIKQKAGTSFSEDCAEFIDIDSTVTYTMIQLACYMGYTEINLIGMDHVYTNVTNEKSKIIQRNNVKNHAFEDENPNEVIANISFMEDVYRVARGYCEAHDIKIRNATLGGALEIFERTDFWQLVRKER